MHVGGASVLIAEPMDMKKLHPNPSALHLSPFQSTASIPESGGGSHHVLSQAADHAVGARPLLYDGVSAKDEAHAEPHRAAHHCAHFHCARVSESNGRRVGGDTLVEGAGRLAAAAGGGDGGYWRHYGVRFV